MRFSSMLTDPVDATVMEVNQQEAGKPSHHTQRAVAVAAAAAILALPIGYVVLRHRPRHNVSAESSSRSAPTQSIAQWEEEVREHPTEDNRINLSVAYINNHLPGRAISLLTVLVAEDGNSALAWNNLCVAHTMQMDYDLAIAACNRALRLAPDFQLARNNLKWAEDEDRKAIAAIAAQEQIAPA